MTRPVYLDCSATTPVDPRVADKVVAYLTEEYGNAASRTHEFGVIAKRAVEGARAQIARLVAAKNDEVIFTSGATESDNLALLGLASHGQHTGRKHIVSTAIEHKAVLEPLTALERDGFKITRIHPTAGGWVDPDEVVGAVRDDTLLVSIMHANNETGVIQPIEEIARGLQDRSAFLHVDAAQTFGKVIRPLQLGRIDLISISGHKIFAPKGIGALVTRRRGFDKPPLAPLMFGGGHERGLRPGTLPVPLIAGFGLAAELALAEHDHRKSTCAAFRRQLLDALSPLGPEFNGDQERVLPHVVNVSLPGLDSEAIIVAVKDLISISNGSACTSHSYEPSHVLRAMGLPEDRVLGAIRVSWCHATEVVDWPSVVERLNTLRG